MAGIDAHGIKWNVYGKIKEINFTTTSNKSDIEYLYDARSTSISAHNGQHGFLKPSLASHQLFYSHPLHSELVDEINRIHLFR